VKDLDMATPSIHDLINKEIETLPDELVAEVLDFIQFLKSRRDEEDFLWERVEDAYSHRQKNPDDTMTVTSDEWMEGTAHLNE
jgi:hypothetical protein